MNTTPNTDHGASENTDAKSTVTVTDTIVIDETTGETITVTGATEAEVDAKTDEILNPGLQ